MSQLFFTSGLTDYIKFFYRKCLANQTKII
nr:MAG TPA: hypothetical protein [Bacteriophage sp.]